AIAATPALTPAAAQVSGLARTEIQVGNTPYTDPGSLTTIFEQLSLRYDAGDVRIAARAESFQTHIRERSYTSLSQVRLTARKAGFDFSAGHFYEILGRGLLLRGFEIPGSTYEDAAFRIRQSFQRDIEGATLGYSNRLLDLRVLRGKPLLSVLPPTEPRASRRPDLVTAASAEIRLGPSRLAGYVLRNESEIGDADYASGSFRIDKGGAQAYVELASRLNDDASPLEGSHALYASLSYGRAGFGGGIEYKDYEDFFLGSGFNDPPSLIREHSWVTLNRSTHVLNAVNERGFQAELYGSVWDAGTFTLNATRTVNDFGLEFIYREYYAEFATSPVRTTSARVFVDVAEDDLKGESARRSAGIYVDRKLTGPWSASGTIEAQRFDRDFLEDGEASNFVAGITINRSSKYSAGLVVERSTDPFFTDDPATPEIEATARHWLGVNLGWRPNRRNTISLFGGTRRGGPACTSGICYEVLDFEGAELRISSRF
ncbi:MAG: hypothetical protein KJO44_01925, partial [Gemmatimonadetes bacterium]|nr:hypothetical protein [Gemmatimonadota bacterium]